MAKFKAPSTVRLNKFIADSGLTSRRKADEWIEAGEVQVNGKKVFELGLKVMPFVDRVLVRGKPIRQPQKSMYIAFNKPAKVLCTLDDPEGRVTVADFFKKFKKQRLFPVGRLDWDTEGLLLMTNDGQFSHAVTHPSFEIPKTYHVKIDDRLSNEQMEKLRRGVSITGGKVKALHIEQIKPRGRGKGRKSTQYDWVKIVVSEGKNRQVRRMFERVGVDVKKLRRTAIGSLKLGGLKKGEFTELRPFQIEKIFLHPHAKPLQK